MAGMTKIVEEGEVHISNTSPMSKTPGPRTPGSGSSSTSPSRAFMHGSVTDMAHVLHGAGGVEELVSFGMRTNADNSAIKNTRYKASEVVHRAGLEDGDLVAFVADENGKPWPYVVVEYDSEDRPGDVSFGLRKKALDNDEALDVFHDTRTHLEVVRDPKEPKWIGFRAPSAGNRFLQARRKGADRLRLYNETFGTYEQWEFAHGEPKVAFTRLKMFFKSRRLPMFLLNVEVVRIGHIDRAGPLSNFHGVVEDDAQGTVMRAMSGLLVKEWSLFVQKEIMARRRIMQELVVARQEEAEFRVQTSQTIEDIREAAKSEISLLMTEVDKRNMKIVTLMENVSVLEKESERRKGQVISMLELRRTRRAASSCLSTWCQTWDCHTRQRQLLHKAQARDEERKKELSMGRWIVAHVHKKDQQERCAHAVATMQRRRLHAVFHLYARAVQSRLALQRLLRRHVHKREQTLKSFALCWWQDLVRDVQSNRVHRAQSFSHYCRTLANNALHGWIQYRKDMALRHQALERYYIQRVHATLKRAFDVWHHRAQYLRRLGLLEHHLSRKMVDMCKEATMETWAFYVKYKHSARTRLLRHRAHRMEQRLRVCLGWWRYLQGKQARARRLIQQRQQALKLCMLAKWFREWACEWAEVTSERGMTARAKSHYVHKRLVRAWEDWAWFVWELVFERTTLARHNLKTKAKCKVKVFHHWLHGATILREMKAKAVVISRRAAVRCIHLTLWAWKEAAHRSATSERLLRRAIRHLSLRSKLLHFHAWVVYVTVPAERLQLAARVGRHLARETLAASVLSWRRHVVFVQARAQLLLKLALRHAQRRLGQSFREWLHAATTARATSRRMVRASCLRAQKMVAEHFLAWAELAETNLHRRARLAMSLQLKSAGLLELAWEAWLEAVGASRSKAHVHAWAEHRHSTGKMRSVLRAWFADMVYVRRRTLIVANMHSMHSTGVMAATLDRWIDYVHKVRRASSIIQRAVHKSWRAVLFSVIEEWQAAACWVSRCRSILKVFSIRRLHSLVEAWAVQAGARRIATVAVLRGMKRRNRVLLGETLLDWHACTVVQKRLRQGITSIYERVLMTRLKAFFREWWSYAVVGAEVWRRCRRAQRRHNARLLGSVWVAWVHFVQYIVERYRLLARCRKRLQAGILASAFHAWGASSQQRKKLSVAFKRMADLKDNRICCSIMDSWCYMVSQARQRRSIMVRVMQKLMKSATRACLRAWHCQLEENRCQRAWLARARQIKYGVLVRGCVKWWRDWTASCTHNSARVAECIRRMNQARARKVLEAWQGAAWTSRRRANHLHKVEKTMHASRLRALFAGWARYLECPTGRDFRLNMMAAKRERIRVCCTLMAWRACARVSAARRAKMNRMLLLRQGKELKSVISNWRHHAELMASCRNKAGQMSNRHHLRIQANALEEWRHLTVLHKHQLLVTRRCRSLVWARQLSAALELWAHIAASHGRYKRLVARSLQRGSVRQLHGSFLEWHHLTCVSLHQKSAVAASLRSLRTKMKVAAMEEWLVNVRMVTGLRNMLHALLTRMLTSSFEGWFETCWRNKVQRAQLNRAMQRRSTKYVDEAMCAWMDMVSYNRQCRAKILKSQANAAERNQIVVLRKLAEATAARRSKMLAVQRCVSRRNRCTKMEVMGHLSSLRTRRRDTHVAVLLMQNRCRTRLLAAMVHWWAQHASAQVVELDYMQALKRRWSRRVVASLLNLWAIRTQSNKAGQQRLRAHISKSKNTLLKCILHSMQDRVVFKREARLRMQRVEKKRQLRVLAGAVASWAEDRTKAKWKQLTITKAVGAWLKKVQAKAVTWWHQVTQYKKAMRQKSNQLARRTKRTKLVFAINMWKGEADYLISCKARSKKAQLRMQQLHCMQTLCAWRHEAAWKRMMNGKREIVRARICYIATFNRFHDWLEWTHCKQRLHMIEDKLVLRFQNAKLAGCMEAWEEFVHELVDRRKAVANFIEMNMQHALRNMMYAWSEEAQHTSLLQGLLSREQRRSRRLMLQSTFAAWTMCNKQMARSTLRLRVYLKRMSLLMGTAFKGWQEWQTYTSRRRKRLIHATARVHDICLKKALAEFACVARRKCSRRLALQRLEGRLTQRVQTGSMSKVFSTWDEWALSRKTKLVALIRHRHRWERHFMFMVLAGWWAVYEQRVQQMNNLRMCITRKRTAQKWFLRWYWDAFDTDIKVALTDILETPETAEVLGTYWTPDQLHEVSVSAPFSRSHKGSVEGLDSPQLLNASCFSSPSPERAYGSDQLNTKQYQKGVAASRGSASMSAQMNGTNGLLHKQVLQQSEHAHLANQVYSSQSANESLEAGQDAGTYIGDKHFTMLKGASSSTVLRSSRQFLQTMIDSDETLLTTSVSVSQSQSSTPAFHETTSID